MATYLLAHDLGTSGNKATLYSSDGALIKNVTHSYPLHTFNGNCAEQNPLDWWQAVCNSTKELVADINPADIAAISFSGQMMGCVCVDKSGDPVRDALIWADMRSTEQEAVIRAQMPVQDFYHITGHRPSPSYSATKLMWVRDHEPENYKNTYKMLNAKDFIILKLTGRFVTEPSDASSTCLMELDTQMWSEDMLSLCGIQKDKMPEIISSVAVAGNVTEEAARMCGLLAGTPVVCGGGDGVCAAVGTGAVVENRANLCLGTSSWISYASKTAVYDEEMQIFNFAHIVPGYIMPCGTMQTGGGSLSWAYEQLATFAKNKNTIDKPATYKAICDAVERSPVGAKGLVYLPYLMGERSPRWNAEAKGAFVGLTMDHTTGDMFRAVMEGVAMNLSIILETYRKSGAAIDRLVAIGGGVRNEIWRQILADVLGVHIDVPNYLEEATSMGAAITAGVGAGVFRDFNVIEKFLHNEYAYCPDLTKKDRYNELKAIFDECYQQLVHIDSKLHSFAQKRT